MRSIDEPQVPQDDPRQTQRGRNWVLLGAALVSGALAVALALILLKNRGVLREHTRKISGV